MERIKTQNTPDCYRVLPGLRKMALIKFGRRALSNEIRALLPGNIFSSKVAQVLGYIEKNELFHCSPVNKFLAIFLQPLPFWFFWVKPKEHDKYSSHVGTYNERQKIIPLCSL
ncbi:MAG TPA: hypothetical protein VG738_09170 [Chitinophagaceae bacterium]|nr:hypothetical protein [Chitinophagaceae bacterium]